MSQYTPEQIRAIEAVASGKHIFLTGPGGTGKSYVLQGILKRLQERSKRFALTAMTGCAALLLSVGSYKASTLHSWASVGLAKESTSKLISQIRKSQKSIRKWLLTDVLIVDEISMMTPEFFEKLDTIGKALRNSPKPFGGIQLIFVGDFYQLPPVQKEEEDNKSEHRFVFEHPLWSSTGFEIIELRQIMRQRDSAFHKVLEEARNGELSNESLAVLQTRQDLKWKTLEIKPTLLFPKRSVVDSINAQNLKQLEGDQYSYVAKTLFTPSGGLTLESPTITYAIAKMDRDASYKTELFLKKGAQVMFLVNKTIKDAEDGQPAIELINGSRGVVVDFMKDSSHTPIVKFKSVPHPIAVYPHLWECDDPVGLVRSQIPLKLAYALTIHASQGATLDSALIDIGSNTFEYGQAYVALSRVRSLDSLYVWDLEKSAFKAHPTVKRFYETLG
jgi:ATP-dependent DNA helicase PIF1